MGVAKEAILERQERAAEEQYRKAVQGAWTDDRLSDAAAEELGAFASELGLSTDRAALIEREVMGDTVRAIYERQRTEEQERQRNLGELYARTRRLHKDRNWQAVVDVFDQIRALDPEYRDREGLLESAHEALERRRRAAATYDEGLQQMDAQEWRRGLERGGKSVVSGK